VARTKGAKDKKPRKRKAGSVAPQPMAVGDVGEVVYDGPLTKMVEIQPNGEGLEIDDKLPKGVYMSADAPGVYQIDWEVQIDGEWTRTQHPVQIVAQTHDILGQQFGTPFLTSALFPINVRKIFKEGTTVTRVMVLYQ